MDLSRDARFLSCFVDFSGHHAPISGGLLLLICAHQHPHVLPIVPWVSGVRLHRWAPPNESVTRGRMVELVADGFADPEVRTLANIVFVATPYVSDIFLVGALQVGPREACRIDGSGRNKWNAIPVSNRKLHPLPRDLVYSDDDIWTIKRVVLDSAALFRGSRLLLRRSA